MDSNTERYPVCRGAFIAFKTSGQDDQPALFLRLRVIELARPETSFDPSRSERPGAQQR
jgi:hypothetical protein